MKYLVVKLVDGFLNAGDIAESLVHIYKAIKKITVANNREWLYNKKKKRKQIKIVACELFDARERVLLYRVYFEPIAERHTRASLNARTILFFFFLSGVLGERGLNRRKLIFPRNYTIVFFVFRTKEIQKTLFINYLLQKKKSCNFEVRSSYSRWLD